MPATQQIIDYGATANDGTGDPLRDAFIKVDENFSNIWAAGPVGSNITITDNTIVVDDTNGNLILMPNGIGVIESRNSIIPRFNNTYNLGSANLRWNNIHASRVMARDMTLSGNLVVEGDIIETGNTITNSLVIQLAANITSSAQANGAGVTVGANSNIATLLYDSLANTWTTNIGITSPGNISAPRIVAQDINVSNIVGPQVTVTATATDDATWVFQNLADGNGELLFPSGLVWESDSDTQADYIKGAYGAMIAIEAYHPDSTISSALHLEPRFAWIETTQPEFLGSNTYRWTFDDMGNLNVPGNVIPDTSNYSTLGNATNQWKSLYAGNTMITGNAVNIGTNTSVPGARLQVASTDSILVPVGNTDQRPAGVTGMVRFNTNLDTLEFYDSTDWVPARSEFTVISNDRFYGDGVTTEFTLTKSATTDNVIVSINGVIQSPITSYAVLGTTLTFTEAPSLIDVIDVRILTTTISTTVDFTVITSDSFYGDGSTVVFVLSQPATTDNAIVTVNGVVQKPVAAYSISVTTLTFTEPPESGDAIDVRILTTTDTITSLSNSSGNAVIQANPLAAEINITGSLIPTGNAVSDIGSTSRYFNRVYAVSTSAVYSDLAEMYAADAPYPPGTVLSFGGTAEVTESHVDADQRVAGVVSTAPSYLMNSTLSGDNVVALALTGRVPTRVTGVIHKGDMMVSNGDGRARAESNPRMGTVIGKALANFNGADGVIEVVIGRL